MVRSRPKKGARQFLKFLMCSSDDAKSVFLAVYARGKRPVHTSPTTFNAKQASSQSTLMKEQLYSPCDYQE
jgi:hypothetical protein